MWRQHSLVVKVLDLEKNARVECWLWVLRAFTCSHPFPIPNLQHLSLTAFYKLNYIKLKNFPVQQSTKIIFNNHDNKLQEKSQIIKLINSKN